jgi:hypothetical protein
MAESGFLRDYISGKNGFPRTSFGEVSANPLNASVGWNFYYNVNTDIISSTNSTSGTVTQSNSMALLQTSSQSTGFAQIVTKDSLRYFPGIGNVIRFTAVFSTFSTASKQIIGVGDSVDGVFVGYNSTRFGYMRRNNSTETWVYTTDIQNQFPVGFDPSKGNVYQIKMQWLGFGEIDLFVENKETGIFELAYRDQYANQNTTPSLQSPSLPLIARVEKTGGTGNLTLSTPSAMGAKEGFVLNGALTVPNGDGNEVAAVTDEYPILSIKNSTSFVGKTNRQSVRINEISIASDGNKPTKFTVYRNATLSTAASFADLSSDVSPVQSDKLSTSISGGRKLYTYFLGRLDSRTMNYGDHGLYLTPGDYITITAQSTLATIASASMNVTTIL